MAALLAPAERVVGEVINLGTGVATSVLELARTILELFGLPRDMIGFLPDRPGQVQRHRASWEKARELLAWEPRVGLREGLARTIEWYKANRDFWEGMLWMRRVKIRLRDGREVYY